MSRAFLRRFWAVFVARGIEYRRDRSALTWSLVFPFLLVCGFGLMFSGDGKPLYKVGLIGEGTDSGFLQTKHLQFVDYEQPDKALLKLKQHSVDLVVDTTTRQYWVNEQSPGGYIVERLLLQTEPDFKRQVTDGRPIRYVDWVVPGILGMNMMFGCLFGVGFVIVRYRKNLVLKRLKATPLKAWEFIMAQVASRLLIVAIAMTLVYSVTNLMFDFYMIGSYLDLFVITLLGGISMITLALLMSSRSASEELTNGMTNLVAFPMMILSGVWFSLEGTPDFIQTIAQFLPLTHVLAAARAIMSEGADLWELRYHVFTLLAMTAIFAALAAKLFRWESRN